MITLRLESELEEKINQTAKKMGLSKSELIRKSITEFIGKIDKESAWELGEDIFGKYSSTEGSLSRDRKIRIKEKVQAKYE
ncbi:MAG: ribbon-helix-helix protein, CopG family [Methylococcaceae bacterium]|nr:ribbon-helix-helix protein, CopG family [Methylococcaceae bacterium]